MIIFAALLMLILFMVVFAVCRLTYLLIVFYEWKDVTDNIKLDLREDTYWATKIEMSLEDTVYDPFFIFSFKSVRDAAPELYNFIERNKL